MGAENRREKSLRIGVHHANAVVWEPVYRTHLRHLRRRGGGEVSGNVVVVVVFSVSARARGACACARVRGCLLLLLLPRRGVELARLVVVFRVAAVIAPIAVHPGAVKRDLLGMSAATLVYVGLGMSGQIVFWQGVLMLIALMSYIGFTIWHDNKSNDEAAEMHRDEAAEMGEIPLRTVSIAGIIIVGLFAVVVGAEWLVTGATTLATEFGVPEEVIGLTVVAIGTSLPELATSIVAAYRGHSDVCVGNVLGSNLFNLFGITGVTALFAPLPFSDKIVSFDLWILLAATAIIIPFMLTGRRISRPEGIVLLILYVSFIASQFVGMSGMPS